MASADITIGFSKEVESALLSTRLIHCQAVECKNHPVNYDKRDGSCTLKRIYILSGGKCERFTEKVDK